MSEHYAARHTPPVDDAKKPRDSQLKILIIVASALVVIAAGVLLAVFLTGGNDSSDAPKAVKQPTTAVQVANSLHCTNFKDGGPSQIGGVVDSGNCWIGGKKYAIDTFLSSDIRDQWLKAAEQLGVVPKWETEKSVTYPSVSN